MRLYNKVQILNEKKPFIKEMQEYAIEGHIYLTPLKKIGKYELKDSDYFKIVKYVGFAYDSDSKYLGL